MHEELVYTAESLFSELIPFPSELPDYQEYLKMVKSSGDQTLTIRTLDLGGDKILNGWNQQKEANPFMGFVQFVIAWSNPNVFLDQLRAILRGKCTWKCAHFIAYDLWYWRSESPCKRTDCGGKGRIIASGRNI